MSDALARVIAYHLRTKHQPQAMARGPPRMDWANQPDPFRSYEGAPLIHLERSAFIDAAAGPSEPSALNIKSLSTLFFESLALSGQKSLAGSKWYLRVNPSSGNLHPTEGYLIAGPMEGPEGLEGSPGVYHYAPKDHALELLARVKGWQSLGLPEGTLLIGLSSIYWRESWKYGERAYRYCMIDLGHALAALTAAAHCLGWTAALWDDPGTDDLARLLGLGPNPSKDTAKKGQALESGSEKELPDVLLAVFTDGKAHLEALDSAGLSRMELQTLPVAANTLSPEHISWPQIDLVSEAAKKPPTVNVYAMSQATNDHTTPKFCRVLRRRRSAQAMDGKTSMKFESFHAILEAASPAGLLPWRPYIHPVIFVHRVEDLKPGLYILLRDRTQKESLRTAMLGDFVWEKPSRTPGGLDLYLLQQGDGRLAARESSCSQSIASDGCFAAAMIAEFEGPLHEYGAWFYSRLYWECGIIGQAFYLASEASGYQGCGIGCFFDDMVHRMLGLSGLKYQDLYHFTVGRALVDPRLVDLPAYD